MENQEQAQPTEQTAQQPQLSINDLQNVRSIIDMAVRRGAFSAAEASSVGAAYDKLNVFLNAVAPPAEAAPQQQSA